MLVFEVSIQSVCKLSRTTSDIPEMMLRQTLMPKMKLKDNVRDTEPFYLLLTPAEGDHLGYVIGQGFVGSKDP